MTIKKQKNNLLNILILILIFTPLVSIGSDIQIIQTPASINDAYDISIQINTQETINAVEGDLYIPENIDIESINDGNSVINFWIEKPTIDNASIKFSGIIPGGFYGNGNLFSIKIKASQNDIDKIIIRNAKAFLNDGKGTETKLNTIKPINKEDKIGNVEDREPPETFVPEIIKDPNLKTGEWVVVFSTQDKISGVNRYEIKEVRYPIFSFFKKFTEAVSPYSLKDQSAHSYVYIKAIDNNGNERTEKVRPANPMWIYENVIYIAIIILVGILFINKNKWKR